MLTRPAAYATVTAIADAVEQNRGGLLALVARNVEMRDRATDTRAERDNQHAPGACRDDDCRRIGGVRRQRKDHDVGLGRIGNQRHAPIRAET